MTKRYVPRAPSNLDRGKWGRGLSAARIGGFVVAVLVVWLCALSLPVMADTAIGRPTANGENFGQYLADHQGELTPFFNKNAADLSKLAMPLLIGVLGWVMAFTMLVGWGVDVVMSRGYAFFCAPAYAEIKRSIIYATGRLFLSFVYTCLMGMAIVFSLGFSQAGVIIMSVVALLLIVAFAAQIVWILYLYRTPFSVSFVFYLAIVVVHGLVGFFVAKPILGSRASTAMTDFVNKAVTPRLQAEVDSTRHDLAGVDSERDAASAKVADLKNEISQAQADQEQLRRDIEAKKNSDIYILSQILQARARGELESARDQLTAFSSRFPSSSLDALVRTQLTEVTTEIAAREAQKKQETLDAARATAEARADLLMRAGKGEVTLSEMRQALIGKTRAQVSGLLGEPSDTASDSWGYRQQMILNPITNEKFGLMVYFNEGTVQSVDYYQNGNAGGGTQQ